jgi:phosphatidylglycerol:prolipoprotein diacylglycerol transferase
MYPILFKGGGFTLYSYGAMAVIAVILAGVVVQRLSRRHGLPQGSAIGLTIAAVVGGLVGARLYWVAEHWHLVQGDLLRAVSGGGLAWYGGLLGGVLAVIVLARLRRLPLGQTANVMAPAVTLGYAVARIGCQLAGDGTYGQPSDLPWAMAYPRGLVPTTVPVQPTPVYEALAMLSVFALLYGVARRPRPDWYVFAWFLVLSGGERVAIEVLRLNAIWALGLTAPQWFALLGMTVGVALLLRTALASRAQAAHGLPLGG